MITPPPTVVESSVRYPWPLATDHAGPAIRVVADDAVWQAALRRCFERWRSDQLPSLTLLKFDDVAALDAATCSPQLLDVVLATRETLSTLATWICHRPKLSWAVPILCRHSLVEGDARAAAERLLIEAGAREVVPTLTDMRRLDPLVSHLYSRQISLDPLAELPLPCWGPAWQHRR